MADDGSTRTFRLGQTRTPEPPPAGRRAATPPKSQTPSKPMASKGDVDRAVAMLDTMYELISDGFELFGLEETHEKWGSAVTKLRRTNRDSLSASPKLAKQIANLGEGGGATTFFIAHIVAFGTLYPTARRELAANLADRPARHAAPDAGTGGPDWDSFAQQMQTEATMPGGYNAGEHIPGL